MPKSLVLGNGNVQVGLDRFAQVSDFYYPSVGLENQAGLHHEHKIGVFVDNQFSWIDDGSWEIKFGYQKDSLVSSIEAYQHQLQIKLEFEDAVYNEKDIFLRGITISNLSNNTRTVKLFLHQQFEIYGAERSDTAYYDPNIHAVIHYKGRRVFLINLISDADRFDDYSIGNYATEGKMGTYKDAEDGVLSKSPIEHGLVDSVVSSSSTIAANVSTKVYYWIVCAKLIDEAKELNNYILTKSPNHLIRTTGDFWRAWVNREGLDFGVLDERVVELFKKSLLIIRTQVDNAGAIIASGDSDMLQQGKDNYSYMWPRDGALVAMALDRAGDSNVAKRFFEFCNEIISLDGYFMHKYRSDKSLGSSWHPWIRDGKPQLPIQEDETALVIIALKKHFDKTKDLEFIESVYNSLIRKAADFMSSFRDAVTGLPASSYDLWEDKYGCHTFTAASVYGALMAAADIAQLLGKADQAENYTKTAGEIKESIIKYLYNSEKKYFHKMVQFGTEGLIFDSTIDASSAYGVFRFGVLGIDDPMLDEVFETFKSELTVKTEVSGIKRFVGDVYFQVSDQASENPWFITTMWLCQYQIAKSENEADLAGATKWLEWVLKNSSPAGLLSEQINPYTAEGLSATPLTWSHSEFVSTVLDYLEKQPTFK